MRHVDPGRVGAETIRLDVPAEMRAWKADATGFAAVMAAKESALGVARAKDRHKLTAEDALTIGETDLLHRADSPRSTFFQCRTESVRARSNHIWGLANTNFELYG